MIAKFARIPVFTSIVARGRALIPALALVLAAQAVQAQDGGARAVCSEGTFQLVEGQVCQVGATGRSGFDTSLLTDANGRPIQHTYRSFEQAGAGAALLLLFDTSVGSNSGQLGNRRPILEQNIEAARDLVASLPEAVAVGVNSFDATLGMDADISADRAAVLQALDNGDITADGLNTFLYESAIDSIRQLEGTPAQRRVLMIFSDGEAEDSAFSLAEVVEAANEAGVQIVGAGSIRANSERPLTQSLERLADETGGTSFVGPVGTGDFDAESIQEVEDLLIGGGTLAISEDVLDDGDIAFPLELVLTYAEGPTERIAVALPASITGLSTAAQSGGDTQSTGGAVFGQADDPDGIVDRVLGWVLGVPWWWYAVAGGVLLLLIILLSLMGRRSGPVRETSGGIPSPQPAAAAPRPAPVAPQTARQPATPTHQATPAQQVDTVTKVAGVTRVAEGAAQTRQVQHPYATLIKSATGERMPIFEPEITMGRGEQNSVIFDDTSVSRVHAQLNVGRDGLMRISDLGSTNGVFVNGEKVHAAEFDPGDRISLGEAEFKIEWPADT